MNKKMKWIGAFELDAAPEQKMLSVEVNVLSRGIEQPAIQEIMDAAKARFNRIYDKVNDELTIREI